MSPECVDLLNKIFQINEAKRIKIEEIRQHPWYVVPLAPRYERAMAEILAEQAEIAAHLRMASVRPPPPGPCTSVRDLCAPCRTHQRTV